MLSVDTAEMGESTPVQPFTSEKATSSTDSIVFETENVEDYILHMVTAGVENDWAGYEKEELVEMLMNAQDNANNSKGKSNLLVEFRKIFKRFIDDGGFCRWDITNKYIKKFDVKTNNYVFNADAVTKKGENGRVELDFTQEPHLKELEEMKKNDGIKKPPTGSTNQLLFALFNLDEDIVTASTAAAGVAKKYMSKITPAQLRSKCIVTPSSSSGTVTNKDIFEAIRNSSRTSLSALREDYHSNNDGPTGKAANEHPYTEYERASKARRIDRERNNRDGYFW